MAKDLFSYIELPTRRMVSFCVWISEFYGNNYYWLGYKMDCYFLLVTKTPSLGRRTLHATQSHTHSRAQSTSRAVGVNFVVSRG